MGAFALLSWAGFVGAIDLLVFTVAPSLHLFGLGRETGRGLEGASKAPPRSSKLPGCPLNQFVSSAV
jgi:hypothetical protein